MKKIVIIICMMYVVGFSVDNQDETQICFHEVDDEFCQKLKTAIMLGAKVAAYDTDDIDVYLGLKKIENDTKKMTCRKINNPIKGELEYYVFSDDFKNVVMTYHDTSATIWINEIDGMIIMNAAGKTSLVTDPNSLLRMKENLDKLLCVE